MAANWRALLEAVPRFHHAPERLTSKIVLPLRKCGIAATFSVGTQRRSVISIPCTELLRSNSMRMFSADAQLDAVQPPYNLFEPAIEADVLPNAVGAGLTILSYRALCRGLLSGRMTANTKFNGDDLRKFDPKFQGKRFRQYLTAVDELKTIAHERFRKSVLALAVRWVLDQGPTIALWGARNPSQLDPIGDLDGWHIDPTTKAEIDAILKRCIVNPVSPAFMAPPVIRPLLAA
jgi:Aldo/keto reductase family